VTADTMSTPLETKPADADAIKAFREQNPKMRERDAARLMGVSEAELVAAYCGDGVVRIAATIDVLFEGLKSAGEIMILTRNESAVHEKIGKVEKFINGKRAALTLGADIDTRMFPANWVFGFAVEKKQGEDVRRSLQFFDGCGYAVMKVHARPETDMVAWAALVGKLSVDNQAPGLDREPELRRDQTARTTDTTLADELDRRWRALTDPHQFHGMLADMDLHRLSAFELVDADLAWKLEADTVPALLRLAASEELPIMCFVGNHGAIQIHAGPIANVMEKGPWINVMDPRFHLHLRMDHIADVWAVRKPADKEYVTSVEAYDKDGNQIIQFFGVRREGEVERADWRMLVEKLPRCQMSIELGAAE
jgi:putative hemin transport protein